MQRGTGLSDFRKPLASVRLPNIVLRKLQQWPPSLAAWFVCVVLTKATTNRSIDEYKAHDVGRLILRSSFAPCVRVHPRLARNHVLPPSLADPLPAHERLILFPQLRPTLIFIHALREVTYCRRALRPPFPPMNG